MKTLTVRFSPDQYDRMVEEAAKRGISLNDFLRLLISQYFDGVRFERREQVPTGK